MLQYVNDHIQINDPEPEKVAEFYINVMSGKSIRVFEIAGRGGAKAHEVNLGGIIIRISSSSGADNSLKEEYAKASGRQQYGLHHLGMKVDSMTEAVRELSMAGVQFVVPYKGSGPAFFIAPGNVLFEISQRRQ